MESGYRLRAYFTEQEWNETPNERKERLNRERAEKVRAKEQNWVPVGEAVEQRPRAPIPLAGTDWREAKATVGPGICPKCQKKIGRGVYGHWLKCEG